MLNQRTLFYHCLAAVLVALVLSASLARAQYTWKLAHTDYDGRYYYCFESISCAGNTCTAAGSLVDTLEHHASEAFFRSTDQGRTWIVQDPQQPVLNNLRIYPNTKYFRYIDQIDHNHAVAIENGSLGATLATSDAGNSWQILNVSGGVYPISIDFTDSNNGILFAAQNVFDTSKSGAIRFVPGGGAKYLYTTSNGGKTWDSVLSPIQQILYRTTYVQVHAYGNGHYCIFMPGHGQLFRTSDNWATIDSIPTFIDPATDPQYVFRVLHCSFRGLDTIVAFGSLNYSGSPDNAHGLIMYSIDGGIHWSAPESILSTSEIQSISSLDRDTVLGGGLSGGNIVMSTDHGITWRTDSLFIDTNYSTYSIKGVVFTSDGTPLAVCCSQYIVGAAVPSVIFRGTHEVRSVEEQHPLSYHDRIFPNPATTSLNIASIESATPYRILDLLGRVVSHGIVGDHTTTSLDVSLLPRGVYFIVVDNTHGVPILAGKLVLVNP